MQSFIVDDTKKVSPVVFIDEQTSDAALLLALAQGNSLALESIYKRYHRLVYAMAYKMVTDHQIAEDILQETFIAVWRHAATYSPQVGTVYSWMVSILYHRSIDYLRHMRRRNILQQVSLSDIEYNEEPEVPDMWEEVWQTTLLVEVRKVLNTLPYEQRTAIECSYLQELSHAEIAQRYNLPLGTIKGRIRLGTHRLRQMLEHVQA